MTPALLQLRCPQGVNRTTPYTGKSSGIKVDACQIRLCCTFWYRPPVNAALLDLFLFVTSRLFENNIKPAVILLNVDKVNTMKTG